MKKLLFTNFVLTLVLGLSLNGYSQSKVWSKISKVESTSAQIKANGAHYYELNLKSLKSSLGLAPKDKNQVSPATIQIPDEYGNFISFRVYQNTTMAKELQQKYPQIKTFDAINKEENYFAKIDYTHKGFHAIVHRQGMPTLYIDPIIDGNTVQYIVYNRNQFTTTKQMDCQVQSNIKPNKNPSSVILSFGTCELRNYDLAVAATGEYTAFHGGAQADAIAAQVTTINRVNSVYEIDIAITLTIIGNNDQIVYTNAGSDPYSNGNTGAMINENQSNIDAVIGDSNYDIGHVFGTNSGGLAGLGVVCSSGAKARGVTGSGAPVGDPFDIDYVCHEMGHQFNANHTQNNGCNRNNATAVEPGSASTIMGYAGICAPNVQSNSDDHFHGVSLEEIDALITSGGHTCPTTTPLANNAPSITSTAGNVTVPANTPFALTAIATDPDGDPLSYCWEQMDNDVSTQPPDATSTGGPNFRSNSPISSPTRYFPNLTDLYNGGPFTWEVLPSVDRTMDFRVTVRDNATGGGCNDHEDLTITFEDNAGPFVVQYPSATGITWTGFDTETVTWDVANTDVAPVACGNVDIRISTDGGSTWTDVATNVANDGSHDITVPNTPSTTCLVMVICSNGTFFDISDNYFTINGLTNDYSLSTSNNSASVCQGNDATYTIDVNELGTYTDPVSLSATGLPAGVTATFTPNPVTPGNSTTLVITNTGAATAGSYSFNVEGNSTSGTKTIPLDLDITNSSVSVSTLTAPADGATGVGTPVNFTWTNPGIGLSYDIEIASDPGFSTIVDNATGLSTESYTSSTLSSNTTYYWRVNTYNSCSSAGNSTVFSFTTESCAATMSTDVPVTISASGTPTITSTLNIGSAGTITDVDVVDLIGSHTWVSDLTVTIESPAGTTVELFSGVCNNNNDFDLNFDDDAAAGAIPCPPTTGGSYQPNDVLSAFNGEDQQGTWTLTIVDGADQDGGSLDSWGLNICINPPACTDPDVPSITADASICDGSSITLEVLTGNLNDATDWQWYTGSCGGTSVGSGTTISVSPGTTTTYFVRGEGGCVTPGACENVTITVNPLPSPTIDPVADLCETDGTVTLTASPTGGTYSGPGVTGSSFDPLTAGVGPHTVTYDYTDGNGCSNTDTEVINVLNTPTVGAGTNQTVCDGDQVTLTANNPDGATISWNNGVSDGTPFTPSVGTTTYTVTADLAGCSATDQVDVTVGSLPTFTVSSSDPTSCGATDGSLVLSGLSNNTSYDVTYDDDGTTIGPNALTSDGTGSITISGLDAGDYTSIIVTTSNGCQTTDNNTYTLTDPVPPSVNAGSNVTVCSGSTVTLTATNPDGASISWNNGINDGVAFTPTTGTTTYTVTATLSGCISTDQVDVTAIATPDVTDILDVSECDQYTLPAITGTNLTGNEAYYDATAGGGSSYAPGDIITSSTTLYMFDETGTSPNCFDEESFNITIITSPQVDPVTDVVACDSYTLPSISGTNLSGSEAYYDAPNGSGNTYTAGDVISNSITLYVYDETTTTPSCSDEESFTITINNTPTVNGIPDQTVCFQYVLPIISGSDLTGNEAYFDGPNGTGTSYNPGDIITSSMTLYIYDETGSTPNCSDEASFDVTVTGGPDVDAGPDVTVCEGDPVTLTANNPDGANITWDNGVTDGVPFSPTSTITYTVSADLGGCTASDQVTVTVNNSYTINNSATICQGGTYTFPDGSTSTSSTTHTSVFTTVSGCDSTIITQLTVTPAYNTSETVEICEGETYTFPDGTTSNTSTTHTSNLIAQGGCDSTVVTTLTVTTLDLDITFANNDLVADQNGASYQWIDCNDNNAPIAGGATNQTYTITQNGAYACIVTLNGCTDTSDCIEVKYTGLGDWNESAISIYPNPTVDQFTVNFGKVGSIPKMKVMDTRGRLIKVYNNINTNQKVVDLSNETNGVYFIEITTDQAVLQKKVVKNR